MQSQTENGNGSRRPSALNALKVKVAAAVAGKDWPTVTKAYEKYGAYLELTGDDKPADKHVVVTFPKQEEED